MSYLGQADYDKMVEILQVLQPLQLADFDQSEGFFRFDADDKPLDDPNCKKCVGLNIALGCHTERDVERDGSEVASWFFGNLYVCKAAAMMPIDLDRLLHQHGAPKTPFGSEPWQERPLDVLKAAFEEVLGETIDLPERNRCLTITTSAACSNS